MCPVDHVFLYDCFNCKMIDFDTEVFCVNFTKLGGPSLYGDQNIVIHQKNKGTKYTCFRCDLACISYNKTCR